MEAPSDTEPRDNRSTEHRHQNKTSTASTVNKNAKKHSPSPSLKNQEPSTSTGTSQGRRKRSYEVPSHSAVDEELVISRKLEIDSHGDEKKIMNLTKSFASFCKELETEGPADNLGKSLRSLDVQLQQIKFNMKRTHQVIKTVEKSKAVYHELSVGINAEIEKTKSLVQKSEKLVKETKHKNEIRDKYVSCIKVAEPLVQQFASMTEGNSILEGHQADLKNLQKKNQNLSYLAKAGMQEVQKLEVGVSSILDMSQKANQIIGNNNGGLGEVIVPPPPATEETTEAKEDQPEPDIIDLA